MSQGKPTLQHAWAWQLASAMMTAAYGKKL